MRKLDHRRALVLFSGGQDSSIALIWALARYERVETIGFAYGQRHVVELEARLRVREQISARLPALGAALGEDRLIEAPSIAALGETALTTQGQISEGENGLPTTFVPGRNLIFISLGAALAYHRGAGRLVAGMCQTDYSGYPDCRDPALRAMAQAVRLGMDADFELDTPLMNISKAASWSLVEDIAGDAGVDLVNEHSHSCYRGERGARREWGYGCGECPACVLREAGWRAYCADKTDEA